MPAPTYPATGGLITPNVMINGVNSILHTFDIGGAYGNTFQIITLTLQFNIAAVGGGGGGGAFDFNNFCGGGGGGAGGVGQTITPINGVYGQQYLIVVGQGGTGALLYSSGSQNGGDSYVINPASQYSIHASGGGAGGNSTTTPPIGTLVNGQGGDANPTAGALSFQGCGGGGTYDFTGVPAAPGTGHSTGGYPSATPGGLLPGGGGGYSGDAYSASGGAGVNSIVPPNNPICWGGDGGGGQSTSQNLGYGGNGGEVANTNGVNGASGVVYFWYTAPPAPPGPGTVTIYIEPHQVRSASSRNDSYKHPGRGLPSYQTEWMDALAFGN